MFEDMALEDKENLAPKMSSDPLQRKDSSSPRKAGRKGRSRSIGPGGLEDDDGAAATKKDDMKNRRKSAFPVATKGILPSQEDAERKAARRKSMANRRVSFAPEATLHTWDVIEYMRDHTTSTESSESTRRASNITRSSNAGSPARSPGVSSDAEEPPSTPPEQASSPERVPESPAHQRDLHQTKRRRNSVMPTQTYSDEEDEEGSSSMVSGSGSSDAEGSEDDDEAEDATATGTAMSLDMGDNTLLSTSESEGSSTSSSVRLERNLRQAAESAGTRGIEWDEYGDESMEMAGDTITNAFKPWAQHENENPLGSASLDQENVNPFSPAFKAELGNGNAPSYAPREETIEEEDEDDMSMDVTKAVGGIVRAPQCQQESSPAEDGTMDFTQAVGRIQTHAEAPSPTLRSGQKRRRSTTEAGSPGVTAPSAQSKRRRSSIARSSMGDETMDLTVAMGGIQEASSPVQVQRRRSVARRRSSGVASVASEQGEMTMDFTRPMGGIQAGKRQSLESFDENEELTMELTTVLGGIKAAQKADAQQVSELERPKTPRESLSPAKIEQDVNTTPKDQDRFRAVEDSGPKKLLTPILQKQANVSAQKHSSGSRKSATPSKHSPATLKATTPAEAHSTRSSARSSSKQSKDSGSKGSALKMEIAYPELPQFDAIVTRTPAQPASSAFRRSHATPDSELKRQLDAQLEEREPSPMLEKQLRNTPAKVQASPRKSMTPGKSATPQKAATPKSVTPKQPTPKGATPRAATPETQGTDEPVPANVTPRSAAQEAASPRRQTPRSEATKKTATPQKQETPVATELKRSTTPEKLVTPPAAILQDAETTPVPSVQAESQDTRRLADSIKLMSTPRKETLKALTPKKHTPAKHASPVKRHTPGSRYTPKIRSAPNGSPVRQLSDDLLKLQSKTEPKQQIHLQQFLDAASIRFMDLTTTKRRMTTAPTPSKNRRNTLGEETPSDITLEKAVVAAACTEPEKELFSHACHELKRYIHEGKGAIKELEAECFKEAPPLIQAYMSATPDRKFAIDAQLRDIKTHARLRSKEMWYGWRSQLLDELMHALQGIAEGLIKDDEVLQSKEEIVEQVLPGLLEQHESLQQEAGRLEEVANATSEEEKEELESARERIVAVDEELEEKRRMLEELQRESQEQESTEQHLLEAKAEFTAAIKEAERVREACRTISLDEIKSLKGRHPSSINALNSPANPPSQTPSNPSKIITAGPSQPLPPPHRPSP